MASFDVESLFTNVPLDEVINIIYDFVAENRLKLDIPLYDLCKLLRLYTTNVQFLFNGIYYRQVDGTAMGSPLGPILADIFMGYLEKGIADDIARSTTYRRYMDDIFIVGPSIQYLENLYHSLNNMHANICFTMELEKDKEISFLDVLLRRRLDGSISRRVFRKPTWSGQYLHFKSFAPISRKRGLIRTLYDRVRRIVTDDNLEPELQLLHDTLVENGYPPRFVEKYSKSRQARVRPTTVPQKPVYLFLPFKGDNVSMLIKHRLGAALKRTYNAAQLTFVEETTSVPTTQRKDPVPMLANSNIIYGFSCVCGSTYVGRSTRNLATRVNEHIPKWILNSKEGVAKSAITRHLQTTKHSVDPMKAFKIIYRPRRKEMLATAESVAINRLRPDLCVQKLLIASLELPW